MISSAVLLILLLCGGGYAMVREGKKYQKLGDDADRYAELIDRFPDASLDNFAAALSRPYDKVCDDLGKLIGLGFLAGCAIDLDNRTLRVPVAQMADVPSEAVAEGRADANVRVCPNCGGVNAMGDGHAECEYCGSVLG